jgi:hypothetical protein
VLTQKRQLVGNNLEITEATAELLTCGAIGADKVKHSLDRTLDQDGASGGAASPKFKTTMPRDSPYLIRYELNRIRRDGIPAFSCQRGARRDRQLSDRNGHDVVLPSGRHERHETPARRRPRHAVSRASKNNSITSAFEAQIVCRSTGRNCNQLR